MARLSRQLGNPLGEHNHDIRYCGDFYGQIGEGETLPDVVSVDGLKQILAALPPGMTELGCHPGFGQNLKTMHRCEDERQRRSQYDRG